MIDAVDHLRAGRYQSASITYVLGGTEALKNSENGPRPVNPQRKDSETRIQKLIKEDPGQVFKTSAMFSKRVDPARRTCISTHVL